MVERPIRGQILNYDLSIRRMWFLIIGPIKVHREQNGKTCAEMTYENGAVLNGNCAVVNDAQIKNDWKFFFFFHSFTTKGLLDFNLE